MTIDSERMLCLSCAALLSAGATVASAQSITPVFRWPSTATATITVESQRAPDSARVTFTRTLEVHPRGELLAIRQPQALRPWGDSAKTVSREVSEAIASLAYAVQRDGTFAGLLDTMPLHTAAQRLIEESLQRARANGSNLPPEMVEQMIARFRASRQQEYPSVAYHTRIRRHDWENLGHILAGRSWSPGDSLLTIRKDPLALDGGFTTEYHTVTRFVGAVPCPPNTVQTCWQFTTRSITEPESYRVAMRTAMESRRPAGMPPLNMPITVPSIVVQAETIVDASTLLPLRVSSRLQAPAVRERPATDSRTVSTYSWKY